MVFTPGIAGEIWYFLEVLQQWPNWSAAERLNELMRPFAGSHTLLTAKIIFLADLKYWSGSGVLTTVTSAFAVLASAVIAWRLLREDSVDSASAALISALVLLSPLQLYTINIQSALHFVLSVLFALLACFAMSREHYGRALVWSLLTLLSSAAGFAVMTLLLAVIGRQVWQRKNISPYFLLCVGLGLAALIWCWPTSAPSAVSFSELITNAAFLFLQLLALPAAIYGDFRWLGVAILLLSLPSIRRFFSAQTMLATDYLVLFGLLLLLSIALGRAALSTWDGEILRYYIFVAPLYLGLFASWMIRLPRFTAVVALCLVMFLIGVGLPVVAVTQSVGQKLALANVTFASGDNQHYARLKLDIFQNGDFLAQQRAFLQEQALDVYAGNVAALPAASEIEQAGCVLQLTSARFSSKKLFRDYWLSAEASNTGQLKQLLGVNEIGRQIPAVEVAKALPLQGWFLTPKTFSWHEHCDLLVPVSWLSAEKRQWFIHLPATKSLTDYRWFGRDNRGQWCLVEINAAQE